MPPGRNFSRKHESTETSKKDLERHFVRMEFAGSADARISCFVFCGFCSDCPVAMLKCPQLVGIGAPGLPRPCGMGILTMRGGAMFINTRRL